MAANSEVSNGILPKLKPTQACIVDLVTCKNKHCYMTGENPASWLAQFVFINLYVYLETGLIRSTS